MLTAKQEKFALNLFGGMSQREAYVQAGYSPKQLPATLDKHAYDLAKSDQIVSRLVELNKKAESDAVANKLERQKVLTEIVRGRFSDFVTCGADGSYIDVGPEKIHSAALKKVKSRTEYDENESKPAVITDIELESKIQAIDLLNKMDKIYSDALPVGLNIDKAIINVHIHPWQEGRPFKRITETNGNSDEAT